MAFENFYKRICSKNIGLRTQNFVKRINDDKILRLFGFSYAKITEYSGREIIETKNEWGTVLSSRSNEFNTYAETYTRAKPSVNIALEDAFTELYFQKYETVWDGPEVAASEKEYFVLHPDTQEFAAVDKRHKTITGAIAAIAVVILLIAGFSLAFWVAALATLGSIFLWAKKLGDASANAEQQWDLGKVSEERKQKNREAWFAQLQEIYGVEMGSILQQLAIQANYDLGAEPYKGGE